MIQDGHFKIYGKVLLMCVWVCIVNGGRVGGDGRINKGQKCGCSIRI